MQLQRAELGLMGTNHKEIDRRKYMGSKDPLRVEENRRGRGLGQGRESRD